MMGGKLERLEIVYDLGLAHDADAGIGRMLVGQLVLSEIVYDLDLAHGVDLEILGDRYRLGFRPFDGAENWNL